MASPIGALETGLRSLLGAGTALTAELGGTYIYGYISEDQDPPYVIYQWQGGGDENMTPSRSRNLVYLVKAVSQDGEQADTLDGHLDTLLHNQSLTVSGWTNFWMARESDVAYVEEDTSGEIIWHQGGLYRIRLGQ